MAKKKSTSPEKTEKKSKPTKEDIASCRAEIGLALSSAIKNLFDDEANGGDYYAHIMSQMDRIFDDPRIPTAAVSVTNKLNLYINSYFFVKQLGEDLDLSKDENKRLLQSRRAAVIKHEILHAVFHHMSRGRDFANPQLANIAADLVVNSHIDSKIMGEQFLYPAKYELPKDQTLDFYYQNFPIKDNPICSDPSGHDKQHKQQSGQQGQKQQGQDSPGDSQSGDQNEGGEGGDNKGKGKGDKSGSKGKGGDKSEDHEHGSDGEPCDHNGDCEHNQDQGQEQDSHDHAVDEDGNCKVCGGLRTFDNHSVWVTDGEGDQISDQMKESLIKDAVMRAADATKNIGNLPLSIQDMIAMARKKPQVAWQTILRQFVSKISNGELLHTKKRISKRFKVRPGTRVKPKLKLAISMDVSGSIGSEEYKTFLNEVFAICRHIGEVTVIEWDVGVRGVYKLKGYKPNITRTGSGGTDPTEAIKWVNERKHKFDGCIVFSDGHFCVQDIKPMRVPTLFVITADGSTDSIKKQRKIKLPKVA